jgi:ABC-type bacteriocin/lantibiotic exporter with double-glycine peptidase domain
MKEGYFFRQIKKESQKKKNVEVKPLTVGEYEETEQRPMTIKDHWLSLRQSIQEKVTPLELASEEQKKIKLLNELITPELMIEYKQVLRGFNEKREKTKDHPQREFIDINGEEFSEMIENWIENLINEVKSKKETGFDENDIEELRAQCWLFFDSVGNVMNTKSLEKDITEFYKEHTTEEVDEIESEKQKSELIKQLQSRYPMSDAEIEILIDIVRAEKTDDEEYSMRVLVETISKLWEEYSLEKKKEEIIKISLGHLLSKALSSFSPSLFQGMMDGERFDVAVFIEFLGLNKLSEVIDTKTEIELAKVINEVSHGINERITNSLFFQEFEFIHEKSLGEIYATLERGKGAIERILKDTISKLVPTLAGITMSLAFLSKISPILGAVGLGGLPVMYSIAKKQNKQVWPMYEKEKREGEKIATRIGIIKGGFEEVKTSPESESVATHVKEQMDVKDTLFWQRFIEEAKMRLMRIIPFDVSTAVAAGAGGALQEAGMISGGAVLSSIIYSNHLNGPIQELVNLYFNEFSRHVQDIQRMDEILGEYEKLDLPEGEKEKGRVSVSELANFDISIRNLRYKDILRGVNLEIKQGEFLTISGVSGAGKSTLLRNLVGLYKHDGGEIEIGGVRSDRVKKYGSESLYTVMSYCNQSPQIFEDMTLRENLLLWSKEGVDDVKIKKVLTDLHLDKFIGKLDEAPKHLSGGERVRIGVARTLIKGASIMLLDEPTASLDSQASTEVRKIISEISEKYPNITIICVSHDEELIKISKRSVNMADLQK